jgi:hypothetical protein
VAEPGLVGASLAWFWGMDEGYEAESGSHLTFVKDRSLARAVQEVRGFVRSMSLGSSLDLAGESRGFADWEKIPGPGSLASKLKRERGEY